MMRLLVAYDGSTCAEAALDDLTHAGLPPEGEALIISVAEVWLPPPPPSSIEILELAVTAKGPLALERKYMAGSQVVQEAGMLALKAVARFQANFPHWKVRHEAVWGSANWEIFSRAKAWNADLIVVGSHGRTALGRLFLGSVSQWLLNEARCSVRVARGKIDEPDFPVRLIVGIDGSKNANAALQQVASRYWPDKSEVRVVVVDQPLEPTVVGEFMPALADSIAASNAEESEHSRKLAERAAKQLRARGLRAEAVVKTGDPKQALVKFAEEWRADCIFLGATGLTNRFERFLLGSVAGAVAARAHCSVEVVRRKRRRKLNGNGS
ncbi:MAG TPA: universal stress protein [Pyrinomonadaceae bacterium]|nr:universal stress protein [Pyrinomonadaceae bacterium]